MSRPIRAGSVLWHWLGPNAAGLVLLGAFCFGQSLPFGGHHADGPGFAKHVTRHGWPIWLRITRTWTVGGRQARMDVEWLHAGVLLVCGYLLSMPAGRLASGPLIPGHPRIRRPFYRHPATVLLIVAVGTVGLGLAGQATRWRLWRFPVRPFLPSWRLIFSIVPVSVLIMAALRWRAERPAPRGFEVLPVKRKSLPNDVYRFLSMAAQIPTTCPRFS